LESGHHKKRLAVIIKKWIESRRISLEVATLQQTCFGPIKYRGPDVVRQEARFEKLPRNSFSGYVFCAIAFLCGVNS
jgi:hypothetical protein